MFALAEQPDAWEAPTACENWEVRDVIGHLVDTMEGYFKAFEVARAGASAENAYGLLGMHERAGGEARSFRNLSQAEMMTRVRADLDQMMSILEPLSEEEWTTMIVPHFYMGPVPAFIYAAGQLMDFGVHTWDIKEGSGKAHALDADAADLLVPFMFIIWQSTINPDSDTTPFTIGVRVSGRNGGDTRVSVSEAGMSYEPGDIERPAGHHRIRPGRPGAHRLRPDQRRHGHRRHRAGRPLPEPVLPDLTAAHRPRGQG